MADDNKSRYLVLSDMHFGTPESSINDVRFRNPLLDHIVFHAPWEEIILTGDLLDLNLSTFTRSIEGVSPSLFGFRKFIQELDSRMKQKEPGKDLKDLTKRWIYLPGNHDYKIWDMLSTKIVCEDVLASGNPMGSVPTPLMKYEWIGKESFFAGIFSPFSTQDQVVVKFPNHEISFGEDGEEMVLTHGHYLDLTQTRFNDLSKHLSDVTDPSEVKKIVRRIFIATAQYQTAANAVSFTQSWRDFVNDMVGPDAFLNRVKKLKNQIGGRLLKFFFPGEGARGKKISAKQLINIETYLKHFCGYRDMPRWFIFGHTHHQEKVKTSRFGVEVYNVGSCYPDRGMPVTFIEIETNAEGKPNVQLMCVNQSAQVAMVA